MWISELEFGEMAHIPPKEIPLQLHSTGSDSAARLPQKIRKAVWMALHPPWASGTR